MIILVYNKLKLLIFSTTPRSSTSAIRGYEPSYSDRDPGRLPHEDQYGPPDHRPPQG